MWKQTEGSSARERTARYWVAAGLLVLLVVIGLSTFLVVRSLTRSQDSGGEIVVALAAAPRVT